MSPTSCQTAPPRDVSALTSGEEYSTRSFRFCQAFFQRGFPSLIFRADGADYTPLAVENVKDSIELRALFSGGFPGYLKEMMISILPITLFFFIFNFILLKLNYKLLSRIGLGILYTYIGLVVFMTGANYGFMPAGARSGKQLRKFRNPLS